MMGKGVCDPQKIDGKTPLLGLILRSEGLFLSYPCLGIPLVNNEPQSVPGVILDTPARDEFQAFYSLFFAEIFGEINPKVAVDSVSEKVCVFSFFEDIGDCDVCGLDKCKLILMPHYRSWSLLCHNPPKFGLDKLVVKCYYLGRST